MSLRSHQIRELTKMETRLSEIKPELEYAEHDHNAWIEELNGVTYEGNQFCHYIFSREHHLIGVKDSEKELNDLNREIKQLTIRIAFAKKLLA